MLEPNALVSVVIPNFNYARFIARAIDSALALDWPHLEVIVVDDGSTDESRVVIEQYGARIKPIFQANAGHAVACQVGFRASRGEVVIFLDSDDELDPRLVRAIEPIWYEGVSKVQFQMRTIDADGHSLGSVFPQFYRVPTPAQIRAWALACGAFPTAPGSGNAYARTFLEKIVADIDKVDRFADTSMMASVPFLGDVLTVAQPPLVCYRIHGSNDGAMQNLDVTRFAREWLRGQRRFQFSQSVARSAGLDLPDDAYGRDFMALIYRACSLRLTPEAHPIKPDSALAVSWTAFRSMFIGQGLTPTARSSLFVWVQLVSFLPRAAVLRLVSWRFIPKSRPQILRQTMQWLRIARAP